MLSRYQFANCYLIRKLLFIFNYVKFVTMLLHSFKLKLKYIITSNINRYFFILKTKYIFDFIMNINFLIVLIEKCSINVINRLLSNVELKN